jgi:hypothetical protein
VHPAAGESLSELVRRALVGSGDHPDMT